MPMCSTALQIATSSAAVDDVFFLGQKVRDMPSSATTNAAPELDAKEDSCA